jgi:membrane-bound serine protease (ClpP class)
MELLLNPDFVYILIVTAFLLTVFAVLLPGTGLFEFSAFLLWAGIMWLVVVKRMPVHWWALVLLLLGFVPLVLALRRRKVKLYLGLTMAAFIIGSAYLFKGDAWWKPGVNPLLALILSAFAGGLVWLTLEKLIEMMEAPPLQDLGKLIGAVGETRTEVYHEGSVYVSGEKWSARSEKKIKTGTPVKVISREGLMLVVEEINE